MIHVNVETLHGILATDRNGAIGVNANDWKGSDIPGIHLVSIIVDKYLHTGCQSKVLWWWFS